MKKLEDADRLYVMEFQGEWYLYTQFGDDKSDVDIVRSFKSLDGLARYVKEEIGTWPQFEMVL
ncbi:hypothetical protein LZ24_01451 [Desulfobotulus alkaliphilus]|uniref:Uncharacterized protein n=1 Tax=Desulfobotulus alkaliphilus TaxID=622671 RepID=A0A562RXI0_9BACT|nr:hypothetical protein [Desulfobotulus alkaliphilus]TWI73040.1 hypothetical protein LZ24_01451 [Desulfobotulus alkaliphilus]